MPQQPFEPSQAGPVAGGAARASVGMGSLPPAAAYPSSVPRPSMAIASRLVLVNIPISFLEERQPLSSDRLLLEANGLPVDPVWEDAHQNPHTLRPSLPHS